MYLYEGKEYHISPLIVLSLFIFLLFFTIQIKNRYFDSCKEKDIWLHSVKQDFQMRKTAATKAACEKEHSIDLHRSLQYHHSRRNLETVSSTMGKKERKRKATTNNEKYRKKDKNLKCPSTPSIEHSTSASTPTHCKVSSKKKKVQIPGHQLFFHQSKIPQCAFPSLSVDPNLLTPNELIQEGLWFCGCQHCGPNVEQPSPKCRIEQLMKISMALKHNYPQAQQTRQDGVEDDPLLDGLIEHMMNETESLDTNSESLVSDEDIVTLIKKDIPRQSLSYCSV